MEEKRKVRMNGRRGNDEWFGENKEDECMIKRKMNAIGKNNLSGPRKKKNHTFE